MSTRHKRLTEGPILTSLVTLAEPIVLGNILQSLYQPTDAFWVGRLGGSAVAARKW
jgi:Na+-driven multidrug efflux pump